GISGRESSDRISRSFELGFKSSLIGPAGVLMMERQNFGLGLLIILVLGGVIPLLPMSVRPGSSAFKPTKAAPSESQAPPAVPLPAVSPDLRTILRRYLDDRD